VSSSRTPRIDEIVARIRAELQAAEKKRSRSTRPLGPGGGLRRFPSLRDAEELAELNRSWGLDPASPVRSHRPVIGPLLVAAKTRIQRLVIGVLEGYFLRERAFFAALVRLLNRIGEGFDDLARRAHEDDELLVRRTEIFLRRAQEEAKGLEMEVARLREEVARLRAVVGAPGAAPPARAVEARDGFDRGGPPAGSREEVGVYAAALVGFAPVLHVPAGRGELLARLVEEGIAASGIEPDPVLAAEASRRGLAVTVGPLQVPEGGDFGAVAITETEAMSEEVLRRLLAEAKRGVRPGGIVLVEALNPASYGALVELASRSRPGRARPLADLVGLLEEAGFEEVVGDSAALEPPPLCPPPVETVSRVLRTWEGNFRRLNEILFPPVRHYAIGRRPES
jgi:SAM-dependent methyltransferase